MAARITWTLCRLELGLQNPLLFMNNKRKIVGALSFLLLALLGWSIFTGVGDIRTYVTLGVGALLGFLYTVIGRVPSWMVDNSLGTITNDDDPSNIPPRVYLPILLGLITIAVISLVVVLNFF